MSGTSAESPPFAAGGGRRALRAAWAAWSLSVALQGLALGLGQPLSAWRLLLPLTAVVLVLLARRRAARHGAAPALRLLAILLVHALLWSSALEVALLYSVVRARGLLGFMSAASLAVLLDVYAARRELGPAWSRAAAAPSLLVAAIACPLFLVELGFSLAPPAGPVNVYEVVPDDPRARPLFRPHPRCVRTLRPGFRGAYVHPEFPGSRVEINALGLRDGADEATPPGPDEASVLVLGDSFAFGTGVELHETFQELLEARAAEFSAAPVRVYGAGVPGFGTRDCLFLLEELGEVTRPDVVVLAFFEGNDIWDDLRPEADATEASTAPTTAPTAAPTTAVPGPAEPPRAVLPAFLRSAVRLPFWLVSSSAFRRMLLGLEPLLVRFGVPVTDRFLSESLRERPPPAMQAAFDRAVALVGELAGACAARGATLIVAVIPSVVQADPERFERFRASRPARHRDSLRRTLLHERLLAALREHAVIVDLLPALEQRILRGEACYHREGHFNARGHALAADLLAPRLAEALGGTGTDGGSGTDGAGSDR